MTSQCVNSINKEHFVNVYFKFSIGIRSIKIKSREQGRAGEEGWGKGKEERALQDRAEVRRGEERRGEERRGEES